MSLQKFVPPCIPVLQAEPPVGSLWSHEVKWDGYRVQVHKMGDVVTVYSRRGADFTRRAGRHVVAAVRRLPCESCVLDGELVAMGEDGAPSFDHLHSRSSKSLAVVVFDVLWLNGEDLRPLPLSDRRKRLGPLIDKPSALVASKVFDDPLALLAACEVYKLEGIVSKRIDQPYRSGTSHGWIKVKTEAWKALSRGRRKQFAQ